MKLIFFFLLSILIACNNNDTPKESSDAIDSVENRSQKVDTVDTAGSAEKKEEPANPPAQKKYAKTRFKEVTVEKIGEQQFLIKGKAQIFEASFGWVIEDGHNELKKGFTTADMGAPEWGNFDFVVEAQKARPNSTLHIILFETSMKDGSRQHELAIPLY